MTIQTTTAQELLQEQVQQLLVEPLLQASTFLQAGPRIYNTASPLRLPRVSPAAHVGFVSENSTIPIASVDFDEVKLMPSDRASLKTIVKFSNEMLRQSVIGLDAALRTRLVTDVATALDHVLYVGDEDGVNAVQTIDTSDATDGTFTLTYKGQTTSALDHDDAAADIQTALRALSTIGSPNVTVTGSAGDYVVTFVSALGNQHVDPLTIDTDSLTGPGTVSETTIGLEPDGLNGILNQAGIQTSATFDTADLASIYDGIDMLNSVNVEPNRIIMNHSDWIAFRRITRGASDAAFVLDPNAHGGSAKSLFGIPVTTTNHLPKGTAVVADFNHVVVARDEDARVYLISDLYAEEDQQGIRVTSRWDLGLDRPEAVAVLTTS